MVGLKLRVETGTGPGVTAPGPEPAALVAAYHAELAELGVPLEGQRRRLSAAQRRAARWTCFTAS